MLGVDLFICLSVTEKTDVPQVEILILEVNSANVVYSMKHKLANDPEISAKKAVNEIVCEFPDIAETIEQNNNQPTAAVLYVNNKSQLKRLDFLETVFVRKIEDTIEETGNFLLLRRQYANIARKETDLSYSGWIEPSDAVIAKYADVIVSLDYKEKYQAGISFQETPLEIKVTIEGKKIQRQTFSIVDTVSNRIKIVEKLQSELRKRLPKEKIHQEKDLLTRKKEALSIYNAFLQQTNNGQKYFTGEKRQRIVQMLEKAIYLDPGLKLARYYLSEYYLASSQSAKDIEKINFLRKAIEEKEKSLPHEFKLDKSYLQPGKLLTNYSYLAYFLRIHGKKENKSYEDEILELYRKQYKYTLQMFMQIPPEKLSFEELNYPANYFLHEQINDIPGAVNWFLFVEKLIGKKYFQGKPKYFLHRDNCPPLVAALTLYKHAPEKALWFYKRAEKEHRELFDDKIQGPMIRDSVLKKIYQALGKKDKLVDIEKNYKHEMDIDKKLGTFVESFAISPIKELPGMKFPEHLIKPINAIPKKAELFAFAKDNNVKYYATGSTPVSNSNQGTLEALRGINYRHYDTIIASPSDSIIDKIALTKSGKPVRITAIVLNGDDTWFGTNKGVAKYKRSTKEIKWFNIRNGLPFDNVSCACFINGIIWFGTGGVGEKYYDASIFSLNPETEEIKSYLPDCRVWGGILDISKDQDKILAVSNSACYLVNKANGTWSQLHDNVKTTPPVSHQNKMWMGTTGIWDKKVALGFLSDNGIEKKFSAGPVKQIRTYYEARGQSRGFKVLRLPGDTPIYGKINALASDGKILWIAVGQGLIAYNSTNKRWYGPLFWPSEIRSLQFDQKDLIIFGQKTGKIASKDFLEEAKKAKLCWTSDGYKEMIKKKYRESGSYALALKALLNNEKRETVISLLEKSYRENPQDFRPLFWKGEYLSKLKPSEYKNAIKVYDEIIKSNSPEYIKKLAKIEKEYAIRKYEK